MGTGSKKGWVLAQDLLPLRRVFGISTEVSQASYVDRGDLDRQFEYVLNTDRHVVIHGDSKQGKSWLRSRKLSPDESVLVQCQVNSTPESIFSEALGALGVFAELKRTDTKQLSGSLDFKAAGEIGIKLLAKASASAEAKGEVAKVDQTESEPIGRTPGDLNWVAATLKTSGRRLVIEDFHYVSDKNRQEFAFLLKALGEYSVYPIIVGIWPEDHLLTYYNGDLVGRVEDIHLTWTDEELDQVLVKGAEALNIELEQGLRDGLVRDAYGNVGLLHSMAEELCKAEEIWETQQELRPIGIADSLQAARRKVAEGMQGRFHTFAVNFVRGMKRVSEGLEVYKHLLQTVTETSEASLLNGIDSSELLNQVQQDKGDIRQSDLTQALVRIDRLQAKIGIQPSVLTYNQHSRQAYLVDRSFLFYRKYGNPHWPWQDGDSMDEGIGKEDPLELDD